MCRELHERAFAFFEPVSQQKKHVDLTYFLHSCASQVVHRLPPENGALPGEIQWFCEMGPACLDRRFDVWGRIVVRLSRAFDSMFDRARRSRLRQ
jgi:hypothetical protein